MVQRHSVYLPTEEGGFESRPLKSWARDNISLFQNDFDLSNATSHQIRSFLLKNGWSKKETESEYIIFKENEFKNIDILNENSELEIDDSTLEDQGFSLESQLRDFIATNINAIDFLGKKLRVYVDEFGKEGIEFQTDVGRIDILATDNNGSFHIIELKRGKTPDYTIGQITRYMGYIKKTIGKERDVFGIIISKSTSESLKFSKLVVPNIYLFEYEVDFKLHPAAEALPKT